MTSSFSADFSADFGDGPVVLGILGPPSPILSVTTIGTVPTQITAVTATGATNTTMLVSFAANNTAVAYLIEYKTNAATVWNAFLPTVTASPVTVTGLQSNTSYNFRVTGTNHTGSGPVSATATTSTTGGAATTWSTTDKLLMTLSGSNLIATSGAPAGGSVSGSQNTGAIDPIITGPSAATVANSSTLAITGVSYTDGLSGNAGNGHLNLSCVSGTVSATVSGSPIPGSGTNAISYDSTPANILAAVGTLSYSSPATGTSDTITVEVWNQAGVYNDLIIPVSLGASSRTGIRSTTSSSAGKLYFEVTGSTLLPGLSVGIANAAFALASQLGGNANSAGFTPGNFQTIRVNGSAIGATGTSSLNGEVISCAIDFNSKLLWFSDATMRATNAWNNSSTANPTTGLGGISFSSLAAGPYFIALSGDALNEAGRLNTGATAFSQAVPTGFSSWDAASGGVTLPGVPPTLTSGAITATSIAITWGSPATGATPFTYQVLYKLSASATWIALNNIVANSRVITGLIPGSSYDFAVSASNFGGFGAVSSTLTVSTTASPVKISYVGANCIPSDLSAAGFMTLASNLGNANAIIIPVPISGASQTSTDVQLDTPLTTVATWIVNAKAAGFSYIFLAMNYRVRDGSTRQTITPTNLTTFFTNLQTVAVQAAALGLAQSATGLYCGYELHPWAGFAAGGTGPFSPDLMGKWQSVYLACKATWPAGIISYAASQTTLGYATPLSDWSSKWTFWDNVAFTMYPSVANTNTTSPAIQNAFISALDLNLLTQANCAGISLISALVAYSNALGRRINIIGTGLVPVTGNQASPAIPIAAPPPYDYTMGLAWWTAMLAELSANVNNFEGFFAYSGSVSGAVGTAYNLADNYGVLGYGAASAINATFGSLGASGILTLSAPTSLQISNLTANSATLSWTAITTMAPNVMYIAEYTSSTTWTALPATSTTTVGITGLAGSTAYTFRVHAISGVTIGPLSTLIMATTLVASGVTGDTSGSNLVQAVRAYNFVGTFGTNIMPNSPSSNGISQDGGSVAHQPDCLNYLTAGTGHSCILRFYTYPDAQPQIANGGSYAQCALNLNAATGWRVSACISHYKSSNDPNGPIQFAQACSAISTYVEGNNEPNNSDFGYLISDDCVTSQMAVSAGASAVGVKSAMASIVGGFGGDFNWVWNPGGTGYFNTAQRDQQVAVTSYCNSHLYPNNGCGAGANQAHDWSLGVTNIWGGQPCVVTEYHPTLYNDYKVPGSSPPVNYPQPLTETISGYYTICTWLNMFFDYGIAALIWFTMYDYIGFNDYQGQPISVGLFSTDVSNPHLVAKQLKALIYLLSDTGPTKATFQPGKLGMTVTGLPAPGPDFTGTNIITGGRVPGVIQTSAGHFWIPVYNEQNVLNTGVSTSVTITFNHAMTLIERYLVTNQSSVAPAPVTSAPGSSITFPLTTEMVFIHVVF